MTNRNAIRTYHPSNIHKNFMRRFFGNDPTFGYYGFEPYELFNTQMLRLLDGENQLTDSASQYKERTKDGEDFTVYTKGDYPKLRILKNLKEGNLIGLDILAAVPGVLEEEVTVNVLGQEITIEITPKDKLNEETIILNELPNRYSKVIIGVTGPFEMEKTKASFDNCGMLTIHIPAVAKPKSKRIEIGKS